MYYLYIFLSFACVCGICVYALARMNVSTHICAHSYEHMCEDQMLT